MITCISSQLPDCVKFGGLRTSCLTFKEMLGDKLIIPKKCGILNTLVTAYFNSNIVLLLGYSDKIVFCCLIKAFFQPKKIVYFPAFHPYFTLRRSLLAKIYEITFLKVLLRSKLVICLSEFEESYFKKLLPSCNTFVMKHPLMSEKVQALSISNKQKTEFKRKSILFVGRNDENKNLSGFLEFSGLLLDRVPEMNVIVCTDTFQNVDKKYLTDQRFRFETNVQAENLVQFYKSAKVLIVPSKWESFSLVALEASTCGCKVIVNDRVRIFDYCKKFDSLFSDSFGSIDTAVKFVSRDVDSIQLHNLINDYDIGRIREELLEAVY